MNQIAVYSDYKIQLLDKQEIRIALTEKEKMVADLVRNTPIKELSEKELIHKCGILVQGICADFGIRKIEPDQVLRFYELLKIYHHELTLKEVKKAFELLAVGDLDNFLPKNYKGETDSAHYQQFNLVWSAKVLQAYQRYRSKLWVKINSINQKIIPEVSEEYKAEQRTLFIEAIKSFIQEYQETGLIQVMHPIYLAEFFVMNGIVEDEKVAERHLKKAYQIYLLTEGSAKKEKERMRVLQEAGESNIVVEKKAEHLLALEMVEKGFKRIINGTKQL